MKDKLTSMNFLVELENLKKLNLPKGAFVIVGSGPLSVRQLRDSEDLDVIVTQAVWDDLKTKYTVGHNDWGIENLFLGSNIEILNPEQSIFGNSKIVPFEEIFSQADDFEGILFMNLEHLRKIKINLGRPKDLEDITLIDAYRNSATVDKK